ncbi:MAG: TonB-dependent receptor, partial [Oxalobacter sp.]|nr:TonB-dependent receptor [Oxalobacter sp.]
TDTDYYRKDVTNNLTSGTSTTTYGSGTNFANAETIRADLYLQDEMKFFERRLTITPGIRHAHYSLDPSPDRNYGIIAGKEPTKVTENKWLPQIGLLFKIDSMHSLYGRYAEGFKMPTAEQLYTSYDMGVLRLIPNPDLKPEEVKSYEAGIRGQYSRGWFSFGGFYSDYTNFIKSRQPVAGTAADYTYQNLDKVKLWGFEASGEWRFAQNWSVSGGATYQHGKQASTNSGKYVPFDAASPLSGNLGLRWNQPEYKLSTELIGTFSRRITRVSDEDYYKPGGYGVFDSYVNWQIDKNFKLTASVLNIFNKRYFEQTASTMNAYPTSASQAYTNPLELYTAPGRTFAVTLSASF